MASKFFKNVTASKVFKYGVFFWSVFSRIRTEYGAEETSYLDNFQAVCLLPGNRKSSQNISFDFELLL